MLIFQEQLQQEIEARHEAEKQVIKKILTEAEHQEANVIQHQESQQQEKQENVSGKRILYLHCIRNNY